MKISIIVPVYNVEKYIERCFHSIVAQTYDNSRIECVFIDDCSPDNCNAIIKRMIAEYSGKITFKLIKHAENKGLSGARNTGIREARGDYFYFFDSDDEITPDCIEKMIDLASKYPHCDYVQGTAVWIEGGCLETNKACVSVLKNIPSCIDNRFELQKHMLLLRDIPVIACNRLIKTDFIIENELYFKEGLIHEDEEWNSRAFVNIESVCFFKGVTYKYYINQGSITKKTDKTKSIESRYKTLVNVVQLNDRNFVSFYHFHAASIAFEIMRKYFQEKHQLPIDFLNNIKIKVKKIEQQDEKPSLKVKITQKLFFSIFYLPTFIQRFIFRSFLLIPYLVLERLYCLTIEFECKNNHTECL